MDSLLSEFNLNQKQLRQFEDYFFFLVDENEKMNLTNITLKDEVYIKHFIDSIKSNLIIDFIKLSTICDIGSGAGFPSIPLKILYPHLKLTIIEPIQKRVKFLNSLVTLLDLDDVIIINGRAEDIIIDYRDSFDICVARAVANLPILLELCVPFIKAKGIFVALKGSNYLTELKESKNAIEKLNCQVEDVKIYELPLKMGTRSLIKIKKLRKTDTKYPRKFSIIKKQPL